MTGVYSYYCFIAEKVKLIERILYLKAISSVPISFSPHKTNHASLIYNSQGISSIRPQYPILYAFIGK